MADTTLIEWARHPLTGKGATWNIVTGCQIVSPGCTNCYAMKLAGTRLQHHESRKGLTKPSKAGPVWTGETRFNEQWLTQPLKWKTPRGIFVAAHGDLFAEGVTDAQLDQIFAVMALAPQHIFFVLTKRPQRMREYLTDNDLQDRISVALGNMLDGDWIWNDGKHLRDRIEHMIEVFLGEGTDSEGDIVSHDDPLPLPNVWLGVSVEDQPRADERIPILLDTPAAIRFISAEPLLGLVDLTMIPTGAKLGHASVCDSALRDRNLIGKKDARIDWVIAGGESGPNARPSHPYWFRALRDQCAASGTAFFFKQWGEWVPQVGAVDGWTISDDPEISRIDHRDWEEGRWGEPYRPMWCDDLDDDTVSRVGKRAAGHLLDGVEHFAFPCRGKEDGR